MDDDDAMIGAARPTPPWTVPLSPRSQLHYSRDADFSMINQTERVLEPGSEGRDQNAVEGNLGDFLRR